MATCNRFLPVDRHVEQGFEVHYIIKFISINEDICDVTMVACVITAEFDSFYMLFKIGKS